MITDFVADPDTWGDAFVVAPDGSRAGLVWESQVSDPFFNEVLAPDDDRWGAGRPRATHRSSGVSQ